jgi:hypothetical protein
MYALFPSLTAVAPIACGLLGASAFLYSITLLIREASIAARVTLQEIAFVREQLTKRVPDTLRPHAA